MNTTEEGTPSKARRSERIFAHLPVTLIWHEHGHRQVEHTYTVAVSRFGCMVLCRSTLPPATPLRLEYNKRIILGKISYALKDYATQLTELGVGFEDDGTDFWGVKFE